MTEEAKRARKNYMKKWRVSNKEKVKAAQERYWEKRANNCIIKRGDINAEAI